MNNKDLPEEMLEFFYACAQQQDVRESGTMHPNIFDNRIEHIPEGAKGIFSFTLDSRERLPEWYTIFLRKKFLYLSILLKNPAEKDNNELIQRTLNVNPDSPHWKRIFTTWQTEAENEKLAYLLRVDQLGKDVVDQEWYNQLPEFLEWSNLCLEQITSSWSDFVSNGFQNSYPDVLDKLIKSFPRYTFNEDRLITRSHNAIIEALVFERNFIQTHLFTLESATERLALLNEHFRPNSNVKLSLDGKAPSVVVVEELTQQFLSMLNSGVDNEDAYLVTFTKVISDVFQCAISDYLDVEDNSKIIRIHSTSLDISEAELHEKLHDSDIYTRGEGITGSILVNPSRKTGFHVGTNNLTDDVRQSPWHRNAYKLVYGGDFYNFWVFPLFNNEQMYGAFRVINRLLPESLSRGYWPLYVRTQLLETAKWFETFWPLIRAVLSERRSLRQLTNVENYDIAKQLSNEFQLSWVSRGFLGELMRHLPTVVHRKIEDNSIGCCLAIVGEGEAKHLRSILSPYLVSERYDIRNLEDASEYYKLVYPGGGIFLFDEAGTFIDILELQYRDAKKGIDSILQLTKDYESSVIFLVERNHRSIRIFHDGHLGAEYYLSHRTGNWRLRYYQKPLDILLKYMRENQNSEIRPRVVHEIYEQAWNLSYAEIGAMLIINNLADIPSDTIAFKSEGVRFQKKYLQDTDLTEFEDLAKLDGAILISSEGQVLRAALMLQIENTDISPEMAALIDIHGKGNRHRTAAAVSTAAPDSLVIVVSENRGISVLYGGKAIMFNDELQG